MNLSHVQMAQFHIVILVKLNIILIIIKKDTELLKNYYKNANVQD